MAKGRPKKKTYIPGKDSIKYAESALKNHKELQQYCRAFEKTNETLFQKIDPERVREMMESGVLDNIPKGMSAIMESYLDKKEQVLLVSASLTQMEPDVQTITKLRHVEGISIEEVIEQTGVSRATVKRKAKAGVLFIAEQVEVYMWCKAVKVLGL